MLQYICTNLCLWILPRTHHWRAWYSSSMTCSPCCSSSLYPRDSDHRWRWPDPPSMFYRGRWQPGEPLSAYPVEGICTTPYGICETCICSSKSLTIDQWIPVLIFIGLCMSWLWRCIFLMDNRRKTRFNVLWTMDLCHFCYSWAIQ